MNANNRLLFVMDKHCAFCAVMNEVLITIYMSLMICVLGISSAAHSAVSVSSASHSAVSASSAAHSAVSV